MLHAKYICQSRVPVRLIVEGVHGISEPVCTQFNHVQNIDISQMCDATIYKVPTKKID